MDKTTEPATKRNISHPGASAPPLTGHTNGPNDLIFKLDVPQVCLFYVSDHFFEFLTRRDENLLVFDRI